MAMKEWFRHLQPLQLYLVLGLTVLFFIVQLVMSHMTHALTLLVDSYHMLCNIIALVGCIITIKYGSASLDNEEDDGNKETAPAVPPAATCHVHSTVSGCTHHHHHHHHHVGSSEEKRLKNTFGWARIDVLVMLIGCVFLASLCFSLVVEALQTLVHIEHHDEMHHPIPVMFVGACGLLLNGLCYLLIGGYTFHQGSFLHVTPSGDVVLDRVVTKECAQKRQHRLSAETPPTQYTQRQGCQDVCRDILGCVFVIVCSVIVYFTDQNVAKFIDPIFSILSAILLLVLSYPYMKESGSILLQTIPDTINIDSLRSELLKAFPDIVNVHDLHVWRLTATRVFSTAHIIFLNSKDYIRITKEVTEFFHDQGITQVTIQPEFFKMDNRSNLLELPDIHENRCLVQCREIDCYGRLCCSHNDKELMKVTIINNDDNPAKTHKKHHVASKVKEHVMQKKCTSPSNEEQDSSSSCQVNMSFDSSDEDASAHNSDLGLVDANSVHSKVLVTEDNNKQTDSRDDIIKSVKQTENTEATHLNVQQEKFTNNLKECERGEPVVPTNLNVKEEVKDLKTSAEPSPVSIQQDCESVPTNLKPNTNSDSKKVLTGVANIENSKSVTNPFESSVTQTEVTSETDKLKYEDEKCSSSS